MAKLNMSDYLKQFINEDVLYIPNFGNAGDSVITHAAYQLLEKNVNNFQVGDWDSVCDDRVVLYGGGGNLISLYKNAFQFILNNHKKAKRLVVLPHTIQAYPELLSDLGKHVDLICRENDSYQYVIKHVTKANVYKADDLAFGLDIQKTLTEGDKIFSLLGPLYIRNTKRKIRTAIYGIKNIASPKVLNSFRLDIEKTALTVPYNNIDLSQAFATDNVSKLFSHEATYRLFRYIQGFETVNTNRLHIGIIGALLGKEVNLYRNSYNKNYSVYDFSMRDRFTNVTFVDN